MAALPLSTYSSRWRHRRCAIGANLNTTSTERTFDGLWIAFFRDPEENVIELMEGLRMRHDRAFYP
jgi:hypothetical protein